METNEFIDWLTTNTCWYCSTKRENASYSEWENERDYANMIYDDMTIWENEKYVSVSYKCIEWGYTSIENYDFSYEEFIAWWG